MVGAMRPMCTLLAPLFVFSFLVSISSAEFSSQPGVNYDLLGNNQPQPWKSGELIKSLKAKRVKIYNANPKILIALHKTNLQVSIMVPNEIITNISSNPTLADHVEGAKWCYEPC